MNVMLNSVKIERDKLSADNDLLTEEINRLKKDLAEKALVAAQSTQGGPATKDDQRAPSPAKGLIIMQDDSKVTTHHKQIMDMNQTIDDLHKELAKVREENRGLRQVIEQSVSQLDKTVVVGLTNGTLEGTLKTALRPLPASGDFATLQEENLEIRNLLNQSYEKVLELKKRERDVAKEEKLKTAQVQEKLIIEQQTSAAQREELSRLNLELQQVQMRHRDHTSQLEEKMSRLSEKVRSYKSKAEANDGSRREDDAYRDAEMKQLHDNLSNKVMETEEELRRVVTVHQKLMKRFLEHIRDPLEALRQHSKRLQGDAKFPDLSAVARPPSFEPIANDDEASLRTIARIMSWSANITEAYNASWQQAQQGYR